MALEFKIGAGGVLSIMLCAGKLLGCFPFSWWWVAAPLLISYAVALILIVVAALLFEDPSDE